MPVKIHGKDYFTVAERLEMAHEKDDILGCTTEVLSADDRRVVIRATLTTQKGVFTGISESDPSKSIEKQNPIEVAETSAVGRALAFAGYAGTEIASADEMQKAFSKSESKTYNEDRPASAKQKKFVTDLMRERGVTIAEMTDKYDLKDGDKLTATQASDAIKWLQSIKDVKESK
jgi:hypothetical protein